MGKKLTNIRHCSHANSGRELADRFKDDAEEVAQYTSDPLHNRLGNSPGTYPSIYDDKFVFEKWKTKPKETDHDIDRRTIRKKQPTL